MNKFRAFILIIVFTITAIPGFYFGKTTSLFIYPFFRHFQLSTHTEEAVLPDFGTTTDKFTRATQLPRPSATPQVLPEQEKILLIQVDNLLSENPGMISMWGLFITFSERPNLFFKAIYPSLAPSVALQEAEELFEIQSNGELSETFMSKLITLGIEWDGYILVDNTFIDEFGSAYTQTALSPFLPPTAEPGDLILQEEIFLKKTCKYLEMQENQGIANFDWKVAASGHLLSDLQLSFLLDGWQWLVENGEMQNCEVLT